MKQLILAGISGLVLAAAPAGFAAADDSSAPLQVKNQQGLSYVSGGFGVEERERLAVMGKDDNLVLSFALRDGEYLGGAEVSIKDQTGKEILSTSADGPLFYAKLPTGVYKVDATVMGKTIEQTVHVPATGQVHAFFAWPAPPSTSLASAHTMAK